MLGIIFGDTVCKWSDHVFRHGGMMTCLKQKKDIRDQGNGQGEHKFTDRQDDLAENSVRRKQPKI